MKNNTAIKLLILTSLFIGNTGYCAENFDIPTNTTVKKEKIKKEKKSFFKKKKKEDKDVEKNIETTDIEKNEITEEDTSNQNTSENINSSQKEKKLFSRAEKDNAKNKEIVSSETEETTDVEVDSETLEYYPERHEIEAIGNAKITFPQDNSVLHADKIIFNHDTNLVKGFGNIVIEKDGQKITGEYIQVDLNDENALISNPVFNHVAIKIKAKTANIYDAQTEALDGTVTFNNKTQYKFMNRPIFGFNNPMMEDAIPQEFYLKEKYDNKWRLKTKTIVIDSYKDRDVATLKNADIYLKDTKIASSGKIKIYTDKAQQYIETNLLEFGSRRNIGAFISPGIVFQTPNASTLKLGPALTFDHEIGFGAIGRFQTDKNHTDFGYATSKDKIVVRGEQEITDNLMLQYGLNSYLSNWFLGSRMPEYGFQLIHHKAYDIEDLGVNFQNRFTGGFAKDWNRNYSTTRFTWQTSTAKSLFTYKNSDAKFAADFGVNVQTHAALYGDGNTMGLVRGGPYLKTQYRSWQQYVAFYQGGQAGNSPMYFDRNFYGKSNIVLGESLRICKYLTLMYSATIVVSNDTPDGDMLQENRFYALVGPDDLKFMIGYDAYRQNATFGIAMNVGTENSDVQFKRLILNDPQSIGKKRKSDKQKEKEREAKLKKEREQKQKEQDSILNRSVKDYNDYNPGFNMMPGAIIQPSTIRPFGM